MFSYIGIKCLVCNSEFNENDDIVVCPECGTPYHRECYKTEGKCVNTELHEKGESFASTIKSDDIPKKCGTCGCKNPPLSLFCENCGTSLAETSVPENNSSAENPNKFGNVFNNEYAQTNFGDPLCGLNPTEDYDGVTLQELADYVGPNTYYYLPTFKRMKDSKNKISLNLSALIAPQLYYAYRKMGWIMIISIVIGVITNIPFIISSLASPAIQNMISMPFFTGIDLKSNIFILLSNVTLVLNYAFMFATAVFSNWFYYKYAVSKIKKIRQKSENYDQGLVKSKGGTSLMYLILLTAVLFFSTFIPIFVGILMK